MASIPCTSRAGGCAATCGQTVPAEQKDRFMVVVLALEDRETKQVQKATGCSRGLVQRWCYACREGWIEALKDNLRGGSVRVEAGEDFEQPSDGQHG
jgi:transposase